MSPRALAAHRRVSARIAGFALAWLAASAFAQAPFDQDAPRSRLRDRYKSPQNTQKLSDNVHKLESTDPEERLQGIKGLGELNEPKAIEYLMGAASDPDMSIRIKAIDTLGQIKAKDATPLLIQQLFMRDTDLGTKRRILASLGKIGDTRATGPITDFLARDMDPGVRGNAIFALGDIGDTAAMPPLQAIANNGDPMLRGLAAEAMRKIRERPAPAVVPPALAVDRREAGGPAPTP
jgi:HEAT repeat protein